MQTDWAAFVQTLPQDMTLQELRDLLSTGSDELAADVLRDVYSRLELEEPDEGFVESQVRVMTMHGAKGLSSKVVFIPGLEEEIFPGNRRRPYPGLIQEGARLLYVSVTRARVACFLSYSIRRFVNGRHQNQTASRYNAHTAGVFANAPARLSAQEADAIFDAAEDL
jgi:DNA helicase-2/ATP-dependent DNA helicase PcrA